MGRAAELATIAHGVAAAADGHAGVVWIEGDAGFGKTALVRRAIAALPDGFVLHRADADAAAREQPFGVAAELGVTTTASPLAAGLELLSRVAGRPALVVVEDLHWADAQSRVALATMARRLGQEPVLLLVTSRPGGAGTDGWDRLVDDETRCRVIGLGPLATDQVAEWAGALGIALTPAQAERLRRHTGGHPLYLRTLLQELTPAQLTSTTRELPAPRSLAAATTAVLAALPGDAQRLVSGLAVLGQRTPLAVAARVAAVSEPTGALERLLATGMVTWDPGTPHTPVGFTHPLYRTAVYDELSPTRRQQLHRAAAEQLGRSDGWLHRVAAADAVDDELATELEAGARRAIDDGATELAAKYLLWAAPLTSSRAVAEGRLLRAARLLLADGQLDRVGELMAGLLACEPSPLLDLVRGIYAYETGDSATAQRLLSRAATADSDETDPSVRAAANIRLSSIYLAQGEPHRQAQAAAAALSAGSGDDEIARSAWGSLAAAEFTMNGAVAGLTVLAQRLPARADDVDGPDAELLVVRGLLELYAARTRAGIVDLRAAIQRSRAGFSHQRLPAAHVYLARALYVIGDWDEALLQARAAQAIVADSRHAWIRGRAEFILGTVAAARGQWADAQRFRDTLCQSATAGADAAWHDLLQRVLESAICRARGDASGVAAALAPLAADARAVIARLAVIVWWPVLVEGLIESGATADAESQLDRLHRHVDAAGLPIGGLLAGLRARLAAATGDPGGAARWFELALDTVRPDDPLIDRALLYHRYGRLLHARGQRRDAVRQLRRAHELFTGVRAEPYRAAVAADLAACGIRTAATSRSPLDFTDREQDVVALVRKGMTNREIAADMYVSEKAVEYHLRNVYGKLGIGSRRELRARLN